MCDLKMKKILILTAIITLLLSCAHGKTKDFPTVENQFNAAEVL